MFCHGCVKRSPSKHLVLFLPSVYPFIDFHLSRVRLPQDKGDDPDIPFLSNTFQLFLGDPQGVPRSDGGPPLVPVAHAQKTSKGRHLNQFNSTWRSVCNPSLSWMSKLLTLSLRLNSVTLQWKLTSAAQSCSFGHYPNIMTIGRVGT